jgi:hypothetical protein
VIGHALRMGILERLGFLFSRLIPSAGRILCQMAGSVRGVGNWMVEFSWLMAIVCGIIDY